VPAPFGTTLDKPAAFTINVSIAWVMLRNAYYKMRGYFPSYTPQSGAISAILKWPAGKRLFTCLMLCLPLTASADAVILVYGDSLSAAYGLAQDAGWPALLQARLKQKQLDYTVANASISGETSSGGAARIDAALKAHRPRVVIVALGANDGLRGLPLAQMRANLANIVRASQKAGSRVLLAGMRLPPNYGEAYTRQFAQVYADLAREHKTALAPFLLEGMAERRELFQPDNIHPTAEAQPIILDNIWKALAPLLK